MEKIDGVDLRQAYLEATESLLNEKKQSVIKTIKDIAFKIDGLDREIRKHNAEIIKKKAQLEKALGLVNKIKEGDWSLLTGIKLEGEDNKQEGL